MFVLGSPCLRGDWRSAGRQRLQCGSRRREHLEQKILKSVCAVTARSSLLLTLARTRFFPSIRTGATPSSPCPIRSSIPSWTRRRPPLAQLPAGAYRDGNHHLQAGPRAADRGRRDRVSEATGDRATSIPSSESPSGRSVWSRPNLPADARLFTDYEQFRSALHRSLASKIYVVRPQHELAIRSAGFVRHRARDTPLTMQIARRGMR